MPRSPNIHPGTRLNLRLPEPDRAMLDLFLFSKVEGRVPLGAYNSFLVSLIREFFRDKEVCPQCGRTRARE